MANTQEIVYKKYLKILIWVFAVLLAWPFLRSLSTNNDLNIFFAAAERLSHLKNPYSEPYIAEGWALYYYYCPLFASLLAPFTWLPTFIVSADIPFGLFVLKLVWNALNVFWIFGLIQFVQRIVNPPKNMRGFWFWFCVLVLSYRWVFLNMLYGQMTILIVWAVLRAFELKIDDTVKKIWPLAFGVTLKILPIYIVGQLFLMRNWRLFYGAVLISVGMVIIPYLYLPWDYHNEILISWLKNINPFSKNHIVELGEGGFVDIGALITKYLTGLNVLGESRVDWFAMNEKGVFIATQLFRLGVLFSCWFWLVRFKKLKALQWELWVTSIFLASIPLAFPHQRDYSLFMMWPLLILILGDCFFGERPVSKTVIFGLFSGAFLMGLIVFFEALPFEWRKNISGYRIQGLGGLIFLIFGHIFLRTKSKATISPTKALGD